MTHASDTRAWEDRLTEAIVAGQPDQVDAIINEASGAQIRFCHPLYLDWILIMRGINQAGGTPDQVAALETYCTHFSRAMALELTEQELHTIQAEVGSQSVRGRIYKTLSQHGVLAPLLLSGLMPGSFAWITHASAEKHEIQTDILRGCLPAISLAEVERITAEVERVSPGTFSATLQEEIVRRQELQEECSDGVDLQL